MKIKSEAIPEICLTEKFKLAFHWILRNSQQIFPPPSMDKSYSLLEIHKVMCINSNIDCRLFQNRPLPLLGRDLKLLQMIFWQSHLIFVSGLKGQTYHRSKILTAAYLRNSNYGVYIPNSQKVANHILKNCFNCMKQGKGTLLSEMK